VNQSNEHRVHIIVGRLGDNLPGGRDSPIMGSSSTSSDGPIPVVLWTRAQSIRFATDTTTVPIRVPVDRSGGVQPTRTTDLWKHTRRGTQKISRTTISIAGYGRGQWIEEIRRSRVPVCSSATHQFFYIFSLIFKK
jgi:hypothetical protein